MGSGREIHISGQKNYTYEKTNIPVVMVDEEKEKPLKIGICHSMLNSLWTRNMHLKNEIPKKNEKLLYTHVQIKVRTNTCRF